MKSFTQHPYSINETYIQHFKFASKHSVLFILTGLALLTHGVFPFFFEKTASKFVINMYNKMLSRRKNIIRTSSKIISNRDPEYFI